MSFMVKENPGSHIVFICHISIIPFNLYQFLWLSLPSMVLILLKSTSQLACRLSFNMGFCCFLMIRFSLYIFDRKYSGRDVVSFSVLQIRRYSLLTCLITSDVEFELGCDGVWQFSQSYSFFFFFINRDSLRECRDSLRPCEYPVSHDTLMP